MSNKKSNKKNEEKRKKGKFKQKANSLKCLKIKWFQAVSISDLFLFIPIY